MNRAGSSCHTGMRKITANFFITLDGVIEAPDQWHFPYFNDEMGAAMGVAFEESDALLLGRVNYEEWAAYWPGSDSDMAEIMNGRPKHVASTTLETVEWENSTLLRGDTATAIRELKQQPGKTIAMSGSATLAEWLLHEGLLDELRLMVHPLVVGEGKRLFKQGKPRRELELVQSTTFSTGVLDLIYRPARS